MTGGIDDDDVFYGSKKKKPAEQETGKPYAPASPPPYGAQPAQPGQAAPEQERDIDSEITAVRHEKQLAAELHDITKLRELAAKHSATAARLYKRYRSEEAAMVKYNEYANKARRRAEGYEAKSKDMLARADDVQSGIEFLEARKAERARMRVAKYKTKSAQLKARGSSYMAKAAKYSQKSAARRERAKAFLEQSKTHEAEAHSLNKRAEKLQKAAV